MWDFDTWSSKDQGQWALINHKAPYYIMQTSMTTELYSILLAMVNFNHSQRIAYAHFVLLRSVIILARGTRPHGRLNKMFRLIIGLT